MNTGTEKTVVVTGGGSGMGREIAGVCRVGRAGCNRRLVACQPSCGPARFRMSRAAHRGMTFYFTVIYALG